MPDRPNKIKNLIFMNKAFSSIAFTAIFLSCALPVHAQNKRISGGSWIGCVSKEQHGKLTSMIASGDREAFKKGAARAIISGQCILFKQGQFVSLTDTSIFSGMVQVRPAGEPDTYWTNIEAIK